MAKEYKLFTIGYEGRDIDEFIDRLNRFRVSRLIDVREIPLSRKKGFSKSRLSERLANEGIDYVHVKELGSPGKIRNKLKQDWNYEYFFKKFSEYLDTNKELIDRAYDFLSEKTNCLMCFERLPEKCHRTVVAQRIKIRDGNGLIIQHI